MSFPPPASAGSGPEAAKPDFEETFRKGVELGERLGTSVAKVVDAFRPKPDPEKKP